MPAEVTVCGMGALERRFRLGSLEKGCALPNFLCLRCTSSAWSIKALTFPLRPVKDMFRECLLRISPEFNRYTPERFMFAKHLAMKACRRLRRRLI